jgi:hypothetical protein
MRNSGHLPQSRLIHPTKEKLTCLPYPQTQTAKTMTAPHGQTMPYARSWPKQAPITKMLYVTCCAISCTSATERLSTSTPPWHMREIGRV